VLSAKAPHWPLDVSVTRLAVLMGLRKAPEACANASASAASVLLRRTWAHVTGG